MLVTVSPRLFKRKQLAELLKHHQTYMSVEHRGQGCADAQWLLLLLPRLLGIPNVEPLNHPADDRVIATIIPRHSTTQLPIALLSLSWHWTKNLTMQPFMQSVGTCLQTVWHILSASSWANSVTCRNTDSCKVGLRPVNVPVSSIESAVHVISSRAARCNPQAIMQPYCSTTFKPPA